MNWTNVVYRYLKYLWLIIIQSWYYVISHVFTCVLPYASRWAKFLYQSSKLQTLIFIYVLMTASSSLWWLSVMSWKILICYIPSQELQWGNALKSFYVWFAWSELTIPLFFFSLELVFLPSNGYVYMLTELPTHIDFVNKYWFFGIYLSMQYVKQHAPIIFIFWVLSTPYPSCA